MKFFNPDYELPKPPQPKFPWIFKLIAGLSFLGLSACGSINRADVELPDGSKTHFYLYNADAAAEATLPNGVSFKWNSNPNAAAISATAAQQQQAQTAALQALAAAVAALAPKP